MSRFWEKIIRIQPEFVGTPEEEKANAESHDWGRWIVAEEYPELSHLTDLDPLIRCETCGCLADSNAALWPCGKAPASIPLDLYKAGKK